MKHGIDFNDAKEIFNDPMIIRVDNRINYGEKRWISIGLMGDYRCDDFYTQGENHTDYFSEESKS